MKKLSIILLLSLTVVMSCKKSATVNTPLPSVKSVVYDPNVTICGTKDPINNIVWLKALFDKYQANPQSTGVILYTFGGKEVVEYQNVTFNSMGFVYYCDGSLVDLAGPVALKKFMDERVEVALIYGTKWFN